MPSRNYAKRIRLLVFVSPVFNFKILRLEKTVGIDKRILIGAQGGIISGLSAQTLGKLNLEEGLHTGHGAIRVPGCVQVGPEAIHSSFSAKIVACPLFPRRSLDNKKKPGPP